MCTKLYNFRVPPFGFQVLIMTPALSVSPSLSLTDLFPFPRMSRKDLLRVCYGKYGCFSIDYPWTSSHRVISLFPESPREVKPYFFLYTR